MTSLTFPISTETNSIPSNSAYLSKFTHELLTPHCMPDITSHKHLVPKLQNLFFASRKFVFLKTVLWLKLIEKIVQFHLQVPSQLLNIYLRAVFSTIFSQITLILICYSAMVSFDNTKSHLYQSENTS